MIRSGRSLPKRRLVSSTGAIRGHTPPSGLVYFLFSDIEGSTVRWEANPQAMETALRRHDTILQNAVQRNNGYVFKTVGDEFCTAFQNAPDAIAAAITIQRELAEEDFSSVDGIRVRMAIHAGRTDERAGDYFGAPVNRVARLLATAHGGQVLLSGVVISAIDSILPPDVSVVDLGWHRLKDMEEPEHVFQLRAQGLDTDFAPIRSLNTGAHNLPQQTTSFIGREEDVEHIVSLLCAQRLVSIVGPGGVGKTRLALQVAAEALHDFRDGVWFVNLAPINDPPLVASTILSTLGVMQSGNKSAAELLATHLKTKSLLLLLDNCEHLIGEAAAISSEILSGAPSVRIVTTTREPLNIPGEHAYRVQTLALEDSVRLFLDRASAAKPGFSVTSETRPIVEDICRRVDGLALAIELAASRIRVLTLRDLASRLNERFRVLSGGSRTALPRQQTMHALIDWSHDLLVDEEKTLFRRLAVFAGSFTLEAAGAVCIIDDLDEYDVLDVLSALVEKSLVVADEADGRARYHLLQSIGDYAKERINEAKEWERTSRCHAAYFARFAEGSYSEWDTGPAPDWLSRSSAEVDNIRGALTWSLLEKHDVQTGAQLIANAFPIFLRLSLLNEAIGWSERALAECTLMPAELAARLQFGLSMLYNNQLDENHALAAAERAVMFYESSDDTRGMIGALAQLAQTYARYDRCDEARQLAKSALQQARDFNDPRLLAITLQRSAITFPPAEIETARALFEEAVTLFQRLTCPEDTGRALVWWAATEADAEEIERATSILMQALPLVSGDVKVFALLNLTDYTLAQGDSENAVRRAKEALEIAVKQRHVGASAIAAAFIAAAAVDHNPAQAARLLAFSRANFTGTWPPLQYRSTPFELLKQKIAERLTAEELVEIDRIAFQWNLDRLPDEASALTG